SSAARSACDSGTMRRALGGSSPTRKTCECRVIWLGSAAVPAAVRRASAPAELPPKSSLKLHQYPVEMRLAASPGAASLVEHCSKESADSSEEPARLRMLRRFRGRRFRHWRCWWRKWSGHRRCLPQTRFQRQRAHILDRGRSRASRVEHQWRFYLHVNFIRGHRGFSGSSRHRYSSRGRAFSGSHVRHRSRRSVRGRYGSTLDGQIIGRSQGSVARRRTSAFWWHRRIHVIELTRTKHELVAGLDLIGAIAEQL